MQGEHVIPFLLSSVENWMMAALNNYELKILCANGV
jgi:hypothetical protein